MTIAPATRTLRGLDPDYPPCLRDLADAPAELRLSGVLPELDHCVAIVGTRRASPEASSFIRSLAFELTRAGCAIVSGGASGTDTAAHLGALDAGGSTIAVLAGG